MGLWWSIVTRFSVQQHGFAVKIYHIDTILAQFGNEMGLSEEILLDVVRIFRNLKQQQKKSGLAFVAHQENILELQRRYSFFFTCSVYNLLTYVNSDPW